MRYKAGYKEQKRQELLNISGQLAKKNGFANTGVDSFMNAAQMTSGAFYSHFSSKHDLFKALIEAELQKSLLDWQENPHEDLAAWIDFELERYLAMSHVQRADQGCILPALSSEVARSDDEIKRLYQNELIRGHALFVKHLGREDLAWAVMCQLVGAILMARTVADDRVKIMILNSSKWMIRQSLGLNNPNVSA
ncbi:TetR/AcrR family transcriptional regulator [Acinetobacter sp. ANC 4779]|uniref:TetR/AcrR family transcriptional regulator n=1 Tax=Acinetobacter sp. ANC 4779 TaxID=2529848 RepID=UPI00103D8D87|nr:TetR/AcrR family transcriptional regulator [Acinetobacter sp. ANC 4779]TCB52354.1 TetR/AcrR family transcriptional regulator [Acinetobacter sp. ANC 4779]